MSCLDIPDSYTCDSAVEGVHEACCLHDLRKGEGLKPEREGDGPGQICCWCGVYFLDRHDGGHGQYEPGIPKTTRGRREATARKEARIKERAEEDD